MAYTKQIEVSSKVDKILLLSDTHFPLQNDPCLQKIYKFAQYWRPDRIHMCGDCLDMSLFSTKFLVDPRTKESFKQSLAMAEEFWIQLRKAAPNATINFKEGNHETRLERFLMERAPALLELDCLNLKNVMGLHEHGVNFYGANQRLFDNNVQITHGTFVSQKSGYSATKELEKRFFKTSGVSGHTHRLGQVFCAGQTWTELGCLITDRYDLVSYLKDYAPDWQLGFGIGHGYTYRHSAHTEVQPIRIYGEDYNFVINGELF